jgi:fatty-acyl-CoA synthase
LYTIKGDGMHNQGLGSWIYKRRVKSRDVIAVISAGRSLTYGELNDRVNSLAQSLATMGVAKGDRVAYLGENHPSFIEVFFATAQLGALFVPLNTRLAPPELHYALENSGSRILFHSAALTDLAHKSVMGFDDVATVVADALTVKEKNLEQLIASAEATYIDTTVTLDDPAIILYTSGTTGHPKGALLLHRNLTWNSFNVLVDYDVTSYTTSLLISPMFHVAALGMGVFPVLLQGGTLVLEKGFDPQRVLELIPEHKITMISGVPTTYQLLADHPDFEAANLSSLRSMTCGGSAIPHRTMDVYESRGLAFTMGYGMTETSPSATVVPPAWSREKAGSAGLPVFFNQLRAVDEDGVDLPIGEVGEIVIRGNNVIEEYWNNPEASKTSFFDGGWFRSGDMGYFDQDGFLFIADRLKDMIISGGENIYPAEVEQIIAELSHVTGVAIIGVPDEKWGEVPRAIVSISEGSSLTFEEMRTHLDNRVARYKMPKSIVIVDEFPRTGSGKIRKAELRKAYGNV